MDKDRVEVEAIMEAIRRHFPVAVKNYVSSPSMIEKFYFVVRLSTDTKLLGREDLAKAREVLKQFENEWKVDTTSQFFEQLGITKLVRR